MDFIEEAKREHVFLRMYGMGPTGSGKSEGALRLGAELVGLMELPGMVYINTELGRGQLYADRFKYGLIDLAGQEQSPEAFVAAIDLAEQRAPGSLIVLDSASHEWMGKGGVLQLADKFGEWKTVRPRHTTFVERMMRCNCHLIVNVRAKMKYEVVEEPRSNGSGTRQRIVALGVGPVQDDSLQYEFNLVGQYELDTHEVAFSGHVEPLVDTVHNLREDAAEVAKTLAGWLSEGAPPAPPEEATQEAIDALLAILHELGIDEGRIEAGFAVARQANRGKLHPEYVADQTAKLTVKLEEKHAAAAKTEPEPAAA